jgi:Zn ribbon nucleic-acid-binding protein
MKTIVSVNEISEFEIKPKNEIKKWKKIVSEEITKTWNSKKEWIEIFCPVCNKKEFISAFEKNGFEYVECNHCKTLYAKNRPNQTELKKWFTKSESVKYWESELLAKSAASRDAKIVEPRSQWIFDSLAEYSTSSLDQKVNYLDISFFGKMLNQKISDKSNNFNIISAGITSEGETYTSKSINVDSLENLNDISKFKNMDVVVAFDVFDRVESVHHLVKNLEKVIKPGGLLFATCPVSTGFEIQTLWDKSPSILPPDKLNFPSVNGLINLFNNSNAWSLLELSTPGMFDIELVKTELSSNPDLKLPRAINALLGGINKQGEGLFTEFLQSQRLSSFARIVLKRKNEKIF